MARQLILNSMKKFLAVLFLGLLFSNVSFGGDITEELKELNKLYQEGILTEEEFSAAKSKVIGTEKQSEKKQETETTKEELKKEKEELFSKYGAKVTDSVDTRLKNERILVESSLPKCPQPYNVKTWKNCNGAYQAEDGHQYAGDFGTNGYDGEGLLIIPRTGFKYIGQFHKAEHHGQGKATYLDGIGSYEGEWFMGKWHGQGIYIDTRNGVIKKHIGQFKNGKVDGPGISYVNGKKAYEGIWKENELIEEN